MICLKCKTRNPIGNKFCKECGASLPLEASPLALEEASRVEQERKQEQVAGLLTQAFGLSEANEVEKALPMVQEAIALLPNSTAAHSLLATLYERLDEPERAILAMKRVVELNPESAADRTKLEMMQRGVHLLPKPEPKKSAPSALPIALASLMGAMVFAGGWVLMSGKNNATDESLASVAANATDVKKPLRLSEPLDTGNGNSASSTSSSNIGSPGFTAKPTNVTLQPPAGRPDPFAPLNPVPTAPVTLAPGATGDTHTPLPSLGKRSRKSVTSRPSMSEMTRPREASKEPKENEPPAVVVVPQGTPLPNPATNGNSISARRPDPANAPSVEATPAPKKEESYIRIKVRQMTPEEMEKERGRLRKQREREGQEENNNENTPEGGN
jgi:ribosomal protein L40E